MITCEQFVFWLKGYIHGSSDNDADVVLEEISKVLNAFMEEYHKKS